MVKQESYPKEVRERAVRMVIDQGQPDGLNRRLADGAISLASGIQISVL